MKPLDIERLARIALDPRYSDEWVGSMFRQITNLQTEYERTFRTFVPGVDKYPLPEVDSYPEDAEPI